MPPILIRALEPKEWSVFRDFRLQALQASHGSFFSSYDAEVNKTPEEWQHTIQGPTHQVFGVFDAGRLVGITAVFTYREDASGKTALLGMSAIHPEYRGRGLTRLFYQARLDWIRKRSHFMRIVVSHRKSNEASRRAIVRHGFQLTGSAPHTWPDGITEEELMYEMLLKT